MARKVIDTGIVGNDGTGDSIRDSFRKVNENFRELYGALGLGTKLSFLSLDETPDSFEGQENAILAVNSTQTSMVFKQLVAGTGISIDFDNPNEVSIINTRATVRDDTEPQLGGNLSAQSGGEQFRIQNLTTPVTATEAVNKSYADSKVARGGVNAIDPATGEPNTAFGTMTGPLILSRDPIPDDDVLFSGLVAATKNYVDNAGFASEANLYVSAATGNDARVGVGASVQGKALAFAYKTLEAALKKAEELIKSSRLEIGPYKKKLTYTNPITQITEPCYLAEISPVDEAEGGGDGLFAGRVRMSIDTIKLVAGGFNFQVGEILSINIDGGLEEDAATLEILTVRSDPGTNNGPILTFRLLTGGLFDLELPGTSLTLGVSNGSVFGTDAEFDITYKVADAVIENSGSNYSLVSVRVLNPDGNGAFGFADVVGGEINAITITDGGSGFLEFPSLVVDLPRFAIYTGGFNTDFTGIVDTDSVEARRSRDIREGLYIYGESSGALAQILSHRGLLDTAGNELFDVDIKYGVFDINEEISYGDVANSRQIAVFVETGIYYENLPLKVPQNVAVIGDEFRRTIVRPKPGTSSSPWAFQYFRRDRIIDGITTSRNQNNADRTDEFGYHYLQDADNPAYTPVNNKGFYRAAASLLELNKEFIQDEVVQWIDKQIVEETSPFSLTFQYDSTIFKRNVGLIVDAMAYDLRYGGDARTLSAALKYRDADDADAQLAIGDQLSQTRAGFRRLETIAQQVIKNIPVIPSTYTNSITGELIQSSILQIVDTAYTSEAGAGGSRITVLTASNAAICTIITSAGHGLSSGEIVTFDEMTGMTELNGKVFWITVDNPTTFRLFTNSARTLGLNSVNFGIYNTSSGDVIGNTGVIGDLANLIDDVITNSGVINYPFDNDQMDVFLMNDATILRAITIQGNGGFGLVLDPEGQILAKSPYAQEGAVFSKSTGRQAFAGGMFVDGFAGNLRFKITDKPVDPLTGLPYNTRLTVSGLKRFPQLPASFIVEDQVYRINYVRDFNFSTSGSTATFVLDETTPWPFDLFVYDDEICSRDVGLIIDGLGYDIVFGSNYHARKAGLTYRQANASVVIDDQLDLTVRAIEEAHALARTELSSSLYVNARAIVDQSENIITLIIRNGASSATGLTLPNPTGLDQNLIDAKTLILSNVEFLKDATIAYLTSTYPTLTFETAKCKRDIEYILYALCYDLTYGGNSQTRDAAYRYFNGVGEAIVNQLPVGQRTETAAGISRLKDIVKEVIVNTTVSTSYTVPSGSLIAGRQYTISNVDTTVWTALGAASNTLGVTFTATASGTFSSGSFVIGRTYVIATVGTTIWTALGSAANTIGTLFTASGTGLVNANGLTSGRSYTISSIGSTNWTLVGAASNTVGVTFTANATGTGLGSGTAVQGNGTAAQGQGQTTVYIPTGQEKDPFNPSDAGTVTIVEYLVAPIHKAISGGSTTFSAGDFVVGNQYIIVALGSTTNTQWNTIAGTVSVTYSIDSTFTCANAGSGLGSGTAELREVLPNLSAYAYNSDNKNARTILQTEKTTIRQGVIAFVDENANRFEILMPGNRSMLSNDFTQINDMGYGLIAANGGLTECVSMFTYYCYTSYYSIAGGQIRGVGGSSAHGVFALAAEGSDPLEVPTPVDLYYDLSQGATVYNDGSTYGNFFEKLTVYISEYEYPPRENSYLEVDHGGEIGLVRYPVISATTEDGFPDVSGKNLYRLNLDSDSGGLLAVIPDGTNVTLSVNTELILTGDVVGVAVRPSTALKLNETFSTTLYRVLEFTNYTVPNDEITQCSIIYGTETVIVTDTAHNQIPGYQVKFSGTVPEGMFVGESYYVLDEGFSETSFKISLQKNGSPLATTTAGSGPWYFEADGLAATTLKDGYDYVELRTFTTQPFVDYDATLKTNATALVAGRTYTISTVGSTNWISLGAAASTKGTTFVATGAATPAPNSGVAILKSIGSFTDVVTAGGFVNGMKYTIKTLGTTNWNTVAGTSAVTYAVGNSVVALNAGTGDGTAYAYMITQNGHGYENGDVIRFETEGNLPAGLFTSRQYFVANKTTDAYQLVEYPGSVIISDFTVAVGYTDVVGAFKVIGRVGDTYFAIVELGPDDVTRILNMKFNFKGKTYVVSQYDSPVVVGQDYARIFVQEPLQDSVVNFPDPITLFAGVSKRSDGSQGTLTIRISLTRVTGHDLLDIGTGSYADTNYPNEIYGAPVRIATETLLDTTGAAEYAQVVERGEGRCFFVTTDQFGNFSVGPFFRVDQGTGTVTFSASLALSNLSGLGFKRGVPISEFSTDTAMEGNATDTVPTENAVRTYIDRRLGADADGIPIDDPRLIPLDTGGYIARNGRLGWTGPFDLDMNEYKIINVKDPISPTDAVNLRSLKFSSLTDFDFGLIKASMVMAFTGDGTDAVASEVVGDISFSIDSTAFTLDAQINPGVIVNNDISATAAIAQSKLTMTAASTRANATGIAQADLGLASFNSTEFTASSGWISISTNGIAVGKLAQVATDTVLGRSASGTGDVSAVAFTTVVDEGGSVKKNQFATGTGFLRRTNALSSTDDGDYGIVDMISFSSTAYTDTQGNSRLVVRDSSGDFGGRDVYAARYYYIGTSAGANKLFVGSNPSATGGFIDIYGWSGQKAITIGDGSLTTDRITNYRNESHRFRLRDDSGFAPIQASALTIDSITTGGATTAGSLTGNWTMQGASNLTLGSGNIDTRSGTLLADNISTGAAGTAGDILGNWTMSGASNLTFGTGTLNVMAGTLQADTLTTGGAGTAGAITGTWSLASGSVLNADAGTLRSITLSTGATGTEGTITGNWKLSANSTLDATAAGATLKSTTLTTGLAATPGTITGTWTVGAGSSINTGATSLTTTEITTGGAGTAGNLTGNWTMKGASNITWETGYLDVRPGTLYTDTLNTGAAGTGGIITGAWTLSASSTLVASSIVSQANSATLTASTTGNSEIVLRDASGNFTAGTISATLSGTATNATNVATTDTTSSASTHYIAFVDGTSGNRALRVDSSTLTYTPSTNTITLTGGALTATSVSVSTVTATTLTTGAAATAGTVTGNWTLSSGSKFQATYADLAEYYEGDKDYAVGTVLVFGGEKELTTSNIKGDTRIAGVVSNTGAYIMNNECPGIKVCIALQGRVPVRVVGKINKGDILITSSIPGVAIAGGSEVRAGNMIGKALENYDSDHIGNIQVAVGRT